jgi:tetratricopeptide (TPR) repeat protein
MPKFPSSQSSAPVPIGRPAVLLDRAKQATLEGRHDEAIRLYRGILGIDPLNSEAMVQLGAVLADEGQISAAIGMFDDALRVDPAQPLPWLFRGATLERIGYMPDALQSYDRVIALRPHDLKGHAARANVLFNMGRFIESVAAYRRLASIAPNEVPIANGHAAALHAGGHNSEALLEYDRAIALMPSNARAHTQKAFVLLLLGDLKGGFELYERRHELLIGMPSWRAFSGPTWLGDTGLEGKTLLLHHEQGLGDTIQFCRYATLAANAGARVILAVPEMLAELVATVEGVSRVVAGSESLPDFDLRCPMMSLPLAFGTTPDTIPGEVPYLHAAPHRVAAWRDRMSHRDGCRVGLVWAGGSRLGHANLVGTDQRRSLPLAKLAPLASVAGISFVSLQVGPPAAEVGAPPAGMVLHDHTGELTTLADTAALIENLDLVIAVDTSVAHLAGALGKPVWLLNRFDTCWRWFLDRRDSPWYPTMRIFRQPSAGDWDSVILAVADALRDFAAG